MNITEWIKNFDNHRWSIPEIDVQIDAGWYDWFCNDKSLTNKTKTLGKKVKQLANSPKIDTENWYVWFKNNFPMRGPLYDDFRFADLETKDVQYTITPRSGHSGHAEVWGRENNFERPIVEGTWKDVKEFFGV